MTQSLHIKTYFSSTVEAAVALARHELGPDAMLMNSRPSPADVRHLGHYEVVFAANPELVRERSFDALLERAGVEKTLIQRALEGPHSARQGLIARMESMISADAALGSTVALTGPPGRGKTSTLLKLAVSLGLALERPVHIHSAAPMSSLGSFAAMLGIEFHTFDTVAALDRSLGLPRSPETLTFVDTSSQRRRGPDAMTDLARCLADHGADTHLVVRADASTENLLSMVDRYIVFTPSRLIFTGLDEIETFGGVFSVAALTNTTVSFLSTGQRIPEDLEPATSRRIVELVLQDPAALERAA